MKPFRFAWNGQVFSKYDTWMILGTIAIAILGLLVTIWVKTGK